MRQEQETIIAIGSNLGSPFGDPLRTVAAALRALPAAGLRLRRASRLYRTPCFPAGAGPDYVNACAVVALPDRPHDAVAGAGGPSDAEDPPGRDAPGRLLEILHGIERRFERTRGTRWGARSLDLDLIAMGQTIRPDRATQQAWRDLAPDAQIGATPDRLILPHPRLQDRAFVLVPLADVAPGWTHPLTGATVAEMLAALPAAQRHEPRPESLEMTCQGTK